MRKSAIRLLVLVLFLDSLVSTLLVQVAIAPPYFPAGSWANEPTPPSINIQSPSEKLRYWIESDVWLDFTVTGPLTQWYSTSTGPYPKHFATALGTVTQVRFSLDGKAEKNAEKVSEYQGVLSFSANLGQLLAGQHTVTVTAEGSAYYGNLTHEISHISNYTWQDAGAKTKLVSSSANINFVVDEVRPSTPPNITLTSPANTTYYYTRDWTHVPYVRLEYLADDIHLSTGYSFDDNKTVTIAPANGTIIYMPIESRKFTLYANDTFGNAAAPQTAHYEILRWVEPTPRFKTPTPPPEEPPTMMYIALGIGIGGVAAIAVVMMFLRKGK